MHDFAHYDMDSMEGIISIPVPALPCNNTGDFTKDNVCYVLQRKATEHRKSGKMNLAIACLKKSNELSDYAKHLILTEKEYLRILEYIKTTGNEIWYNHIEADIRKKHPEFENKRSANKNRIQEAIGKANFNGTDLLLFSASKNCPICGKYEKALFSISGRSNKYPQLPQELLEGGCSEHIIGANPFIERINSPTVVTNTPIRITEPPKQKKGGFLQSIFGDKSNQNKIFPCKQCGNPLRLEGRIGYCDTCRSSYDMVNNLKPVDVVKMGKYNCSPNWQISISFGKSTSSNYPKAVLLAKSAPQYHEQMDDGKILHQATYSSKPSEYLAFIQLYELVEKWKSSFTFINGVMMDRKIVGQLNYCYGDMCRSGNPAFCFGASFMTDNPFGCHRLQISAYNNPWWTFYKKTGYNQWTLDKLALKNRIDSHANIYNICPVFDYNYAIAVINALPTTVSTQQLERIKDNQFSF